jgi:hypothetical protein
MLLSHKCNVINTPWQVCCNDTQRQPSPLSLQNELIDYPAEITVTFISVDTASIRCKIWNSAVAIMDIFGTTVTVISEIYNITIFIKGVITDIKSRESDGQEIQHKLDHELLFLDSFKKLFFDSNGSFIYDDRLPGNLLQDVEVILSALRKVLAEYGMLAAKHGLLHPETAEQTRPFSNENDTPTPIHRRIQLKLKDVKKRTFDWALFDKDKILEILDAYSGWTERLRQTMTLMLLTLAAFDGDAHKRFADSSDARDLGIQSVAKRQLLTRTAPPIEFTALNGHIIEYPGQASSSDIKLATYVDDWHVSENVLVEHRKYSNELIVATDFKSPLVGTLKASARSLAWLLRSSFPPDTEVYSSDIRDHSGFLTLPCLGYLDQPDEHRYLFLYKLPSKVTYPLTRQVITLHDLINGGNQSNLVSTKSSLGNRFFMANTLASTLLNIHSFGWLHKNIWSRGVIVFPCFTSSLPSQWLAPYLTGWGIARPILDSTELAPDIEIEPNFYRHPKRQGQPTDTFDIEHDIYALGVILLEIGLWETVSVMFKLQIDKAIAGKHLPEPETIRTALVETAKGKLGAEMGESYMKAVVRCLTGEFGFKKYEDRRSTLLIAFRETVVEVTAKGLGL